MNIKIITQKISNEEFRSFLGQYFDDMIKFVVDVERRVIALGGEMHADAEEVLLENGSTQQNLWGANIYPDRLGEEKLEYVSLINIRPAQQNRSMEIQDDVRRETIKNIVTELIELT